MEAGFLLAWHSEQDAIGSSNPAAIRVHAHHLLYKSRVIWMKSNVKRSPMVFVGVLNGLLVAAQPDRVGALFTPSGAWQLFWAISGYHVGPPRKP